MMGTYISPRIIGFAAEHLAALRAALDAAPRSAEEVARVLREHVQRFPRLAGYGVPMREEDERLRALRGYMARKGRAELAHWRAQETLSPMLRETKGLAPNVGIGLAAALLDIGCSPEQAGALSTFLHQQDFAANVYEASQQRAAAYQRLPEDRVEYAGAPPRESPRAKR
jgi:hypothetical protein